MSEKKIGIGIIHGMGEQSDNFVDEFRERIKGMYHDNTLGFSSDELYIKGILWAGILNDIQRELCQKVNYKNDLSFESLRGFVINYLGDPIAYQKTREYKDLKPGDRRLYFDIQELIANNVTSIIQNISPGVPVVLIGHSLGAVMLLNYVYDSQKDPADKEKIGWSVPEIEMLAGIITMGNPFALWSVRYMNFGRVIDFPGRMVTGKLKDAAKWYNFYDTEDILAYPLKNLNDSYKDLAQLEDVRVKMEGMVQDYTPLAHEGYFKSFDVAERISLFLREIRSAM
jgi:hypothetical protein